ncbi:MAG: SCO family protein [Gammaproteobacteria bacterium]
MRKKSRLRKYNRQQTGILIFIGIIALLLGIYYGNGKQNTHQGIAKWDTSQLHATVFPQARTIQAFNLINENGQPFTAKDLANHWTFVFFGFTNCPNICPVTMGKLKVLYSQLQQQSLPAQVYMISIDPERDTPQRLKTYVQTFNANFHGATGDINEINRLTKELGVVFMKLKPNDNDPQQASYGIEHSGSILLFNPQGKLQALFTAPHQPQKMAQEFKQITQHYVG